MYQSQDAMQSARPLRSGVRQRRATIVSVIEVLLFIVVGAAVLLALFFDSRLYYGIGVQELPVRTRLQIFDVAENSPSLHSEEGMLLGSAPSHTMSDAHDARMQDDDTTG